MFVCSPIQQDLFQQLNPQTSPDLNPEITSQDHSLQTKNLLLQSKLKIVILFLQIFKSLWSLQQLQNKFVIL
jgi:hypothetical protein